MSGGRGAILDLWVGTTLPPYCVKSCLAQPSIWLNRAWSVSCDQSQASTFSLIGRAGFISSVRSRPLLHGSASHMFHRLSPRPLRECLGYMLADGTFALDCHRSRNRKRVRLYRSDQMLFDPNERYVYRGRVAHQTQRARGGVGQRCASGLIPEIDGCHDVFCHWY